MRNFLLGAMVGVLLATIVFRLHLQRLEERQSELDVRVTKALDGALLRLEACQAAGR